MFVLLLLRMEVAALGLQQVALINIVVLLLFVQLWDLLLLLLFWLVQLLLHYWV
jgi:hypothetical protein